MILTQIIFFIFALLLTSAAFMTVFSQNPVRSALCLVLTFFAAAGLWMLLAAEFLSLILVLVYVGAVMTLFLFVIMTLNLTITKTENPLKYLPYTVLGLILFIGLLLYSLSPEHWDNLFAPMQLPASNTQALGDILYTDYAYPFEIIGVLLLVAMIAAVGLTVRSARSSKAIPPEAQIHIEKASRIRLVSMKAEKP